MKQKQLDILISPFFLICLLVLLSNDFIFKQQFHNEITGKLSDVAGLIVFSLFWYSFFPHLKLQIHFFTAALFIFWKSAYSQPIIDVWNSLSLFSIGRTIDYSDLFALLVLPISYLCTALPSTISKQRCVTCLIAIISIFAFTATSFSEKTAYETEYYFPNSKKELIERMSYLPENEVFKWFKDSDKFEVAFDSCISSATITVTEKSAQTIITLKEIDYRCPNGGDKEEMSEFFEKEFINKIKENPRNKSPKIDYIWAERPPSYKDSNSQ